MPKACLLLLNRSVFPSPERLKTEPGQATLKAWYRITAVYYRGCFLTPQYHKSCSDQAGPVGTTCRSARRLSSYGWLAKISVGFRLCLDDVGIGTCIAVEGSDPVVVGRIGSQAGHILTSHIAHVAILIAGNVSDKGTARGDV